MRRTRRPLKISFGAHLVTSPLPRQRGVGEERTNERRQFRGKKSTSIPTARWSSPCLGRCRGKLTVLLTFHPTLSLRLTWRSTLLVKNVGSADYGRYDCVAQNEEGLARHSITLNVTSAPDPPTGLIPINPTYTAVLLGWTPGFDGGHEQKFRIRYRKKNERGYRYVDVENATESDDGQITFEVLDLKDNTEYVFAVMASNAVGRSNYTQNIHGVKTKGEIHIMHVKWQTFNGWWWDAQRFIAVIPVGPTGPYPPPTWPRGIVIVITLAAAAVLVANAALLSCYVKRRGDRKQLIGEP